MIRTIQSTLCDLLVVRSPSFRGKVRIAQVIHSLFDGAPVATPYGVIVAADLKDKTNCFALMRPPGDVVADAVARLEPGDAFIDIGANSGEFSILASKRVGRQGVVVAFEPQPEMCSKLSKNLQLNGVTNLFLIQAAVGQESGVSRMSTSDGHSGAAHVSVNGSQSVFMVDPADISGLISKLIGRRRVILKIDVEGMEWNVLASIRPWFSSLDIDTCIVELVESNLARFGKSRADIYALMDEYGFTGTLKPDRIHHYDQVFARH